MTTSETIRDDFRQAMRRLATTITIVTTGKGADWCGMVATAVTSVTADPPTLLVAVNRNASIAPVLQLEQRFCVNLLAERHQHLVGTFSGKAKGLARFEGGNWTASTEGLPVLADAVASVICETQNMLDVGTHTLFVGEVQYIVNHPDIDPLIWVDGKFATVQCLEIVTS